MTDAAIIVHRMPGRIRLRIPTKKGNADYFARLTEACGKLDTIDKIKANATTGSLVIEFQGSHERLFEQMQDCDLRIVRAGPEAVRPVGRTGSRQMPNLTERRIDPMFMVGSAFLVLGVVQVVRGNIMVPSLTLLWYAMDAFRHSQGSHSQGNL